MSIAVYNTNLLVVCAQPEVAAVVHFFKNQLSRGSGSRLARAESFGKMRTSGSSTKGY